MVESETKYLKQMPVFCETCSVHECCCCYCSVRKKGMSKEYTKQKNNDNNNSNQPYEMFRRQPTLLLLWNIIYF